MKKRLQNVAVLIVVALVFTAVGAYAASNYGSQSDPLITMSYVTKVLQPSIESSFENTVTASMTQLEQQFESELTGAFKTVSVESGKTMTCNAGCELLFRSGSASATGTSGLLDVTSGSTVSSGQSMTQNHLYMTSAAGNGFKATNAVTVLVRGTYTIA